MKVCFLLTYFYKSDIVTVKKQPKIAKMQKMVFPTKINGKFSLKLYISMDLFLLQFLQYENFFSFCIIGMNKQIKQLEAQESLNRSPGVQRIKIGYLSDIT